jgi:uncharacterized membrane protein
MQMNPHRGESTIGISDAERWGAVIAAAVLVGYGTTRKSMPGYLFAMAATPLAYRAISGRWPEIARRFVPSDDTREALAGNRGINVRESIRLEKPIDEVYRFWRRLENLPSFMNHLVSVTDLGNGRSHWIAKGPAGLKAEWDAEIINEVENQTIGWRSLPDADVVSAGSVTFKSVRGGQSTQIAVNLQYEPPAGKAGSYLAMLMGREPSQIIREDLRRLKQVLEAGEVAQAVPPEQQGIY